MLLTLFILLVWSMQNMVISIRVQSTFNLVVEMSLFYTTSKTYRQQNSNQISRLHMFPKSTICIPAVASPGRNAAHCTVIHSRFILANLQHYIKAHDSFPALLHSDCMICAT